MFLQNSPPNTSGYMIAGYAVAFIVMALYVASLYLRSRNLSQDLSMLEEMEQSGEAGDQPKGAPKTVTKKNGEK